jgi:predicted metal-binding membrane protein
MIRIISLIVIVVLVISGGFWVFNKVFENLPSKSLILILITGVILGVAGTYVFFIYF